MSYNRHGWAFISILSVLLFIEPREMKGWAVDPLLALLLTVSLFYIKITYFVAAEAAIFVALVSRPWVTRERLCWLAAAVAALLIALAPGNFAYWADIIDAIESGSARSQVPRNIRLILDDNVEFTLAAAQCLAVVILWRRGVGTFGTVISAFFISSAGLFLLSQNADGVRQVPLFLVGGLLIYRLVLRSLSPWARPVMLATLLPIAGLVLVYLAGFANYVDRARRVDTLTVSSTNLRGLRVPDDADHVIDDITRGSFGPDTFRRLRAQHVRYEITQREYVLSILALVDYLLGQGEEKARVVVLDQVNPMPFVLGAPPPSGGNQWSGPTVSWRSADAFLADTDVVAVPVFPTRKEVTDLAVAFYRAALAARFERIDTPYWIVYRRRAPI